jgi:hypothetical protein
MKRKVSEPTEFRVGSEGVYKVGINASNLESTIMSPDFIFGYISISIVGVLIVGLLGLAWAALWKFRYVPSP